MTQLRRFAIGLIHPASSDTAFILPCHDRVLPGDRVRGTVGPRATRTVGTDAQTPWIEGVVEDVATIGPPAEHRVSIRVTACSGGFGFAPGNLTTLPMRNLFGGRIFRVLWDDEEERARIEARERGKVFETEEPSLVRSDDRPRQVLDRGDDYDLSM